jgi:bifunctional DNA-binding transcriptional regulator/antitoxin component of YhaV-PrlF toxin-antitoxin module
MPRISPDHRITVPVDVLRCAGMSAGDRVEVTSPAPGRVEVTSTEALIAKYAGCFDETVYPPGYLDEIRG